MKNPFIAPDIKNIMHDKHIAKNHAIALMLSGAVLVVLLLGSYYLAVKLGVFPNFFGGPVVIPEQQVSPEIPTEQQPQGRSIEERLADFEQGVYDPTVIEERTAEMNAPATAEGEGRTLEERLADFENQ